MTKKFKQKNGVAAKIGMTISYFFPKSNNILIAYPTPNREKTSNNHGLVLNLVSKYLPTNTLPRTVVIIVAAI